MSRLLTAVVAAYGLAAATTVGCAGPELPTLALTEQRRWVLPDTATLVGATLSARGAVAAWLRNPGGVFVLDRDGRMQAMPDLRAGDPVGAAFATGDSVVEVVDARSSTVLVAHAGSGSFTGHPYSVPIVVTSAVRAQGGSWFLGGIDGEGFFRVYELQPDRRGSRLYGKVAAIPGNPFASAHASLSIAGDCLLVSFLDHPYSVVALCSNGEVARWPTVTGQPTAPRENGQEWIALGVWPLDSGYVRTFSDVRSDVRDLVLYSRAGQFVRQTSVATAFAVVGTVPDAQLLLAAHRVDHAYLVLYHWHWAPQTRTSMLGLRARIPAHKNAPVGATIAFRR